MNITLETVTKRFRLRDGFAGHVDTITAADAMSLGFELESVDISI